MQYLSNPELISIRPDYPGNQCYNGRFLNYIKVTAPTLTDLLRWRWNRKPTQTVADDFQLTVESTPRLLDASPAKIVWLGHASFLLSLNNKNIVLDPVFGNIPFVKRRAKLPGAVSDYQPIDYILISHSHYDHLDRKTITALCQLNPQVKIYCGLNTAKLLKKWQIQVAIIEAGWYQRFPVFNDGLKIYFMPALHWSKRSLRDRNWRLWGSFIIQSSSSCIYFMGDSGYANHFKEIGQLFPSIDYALLGIGAYMPRNIMQSSHLNPEEAYQAWQDLGARTLIPMHYATYNLTDEPISEPLTRIQAAFNHQPQCLNILNPGQCFWL